MTIDELDRLRRAVEEEASRGDRAEGGGPGAFGETVVLFRRLASRARDEFQRGAEVEPRLSSGLQTLAAMLLEPAVGQMPGPSTSKALADGSGQLVWPRCP
jgi:hypothetical protein